MAGVVSEKKARIEKEAVRIPEDVTVKILERLPVKSLMRFICACKTWSSVISDPEFCNNLHRMRACVLNCEKSKKFSTVTIESLLMNEETPIRPTPLSLPWQPEPEPFDESQFLGSCNGLICVAHKIPDRDRSGLILWNPSTRKFRRLPPARLFRGHRSHHWTYAWFGYDESVDDYKVVWVRGRYLCPRGIELDVFTLKSNTWRSGHTPPTDIIFSSRDSYGYKSIGVLSNGAIHWVTRYKGCSIRCSIRILALDLDSEKFRLLESPHRFMLDYSTWVGIWVGSLSGCLCLCMHYDYEGPVSLWMMKEYGVDSSWINLLSLRTTCIDPVGTFIHTGVRCRISPILFSNEEGNMVALLEYVYKGCTFPNHEDKIVRLQIEKGAKVSAEILLRVSRDRRHIIDVYEGPLWQNYAVLHMEESLVSVN